MSEGIYNRNRKSSRRQAKAVPIKTGFAFTGLIKLQNIIIKRSHFYTFGGGLISSMGEGGVYREMGL